MALLFLIGRLHNLTSFCSIWKTEIRFTLNFKNVKWKTEIDSCRSSFGRSFLNREITQPYQPSLNMKDRNWFMKELLFAILLLIWRLQDLTSSCANSQELFWPFFSKLEDSSTLAAPARNEIQKLVHAGASLALLFLIGGLQDLIGSCSKLFEIILFWISYTTLSIPKTRILKNLARGKIL